MTTGAPSTIPKILLGLSLGMLLVTVITLMSAQPPGNRGLPHSIFPKTMLEGGSGVERLGPVRWLGLAFVLCQVGIYVSCLALRRSRRRVIIMATVGLLFAATFVALVVVDLFYARGELREVVAGLPWPTAIMIYGVCGVPILFIMLYTVFFDSWVMTPDELARIEALAARYQEQRELTA